VKNDHDQKKEIVTIKERTLKLNLSDADVERICLKAGSAGLTVPELLQNFIGDLVDGTYSNGSDERECANEWFNRCWFGMFPDKTFLWYLIDYDCLEDVLESWRDKEGAQEELKRAEIQPDEFEPDEIEGYKEDLKYWQDSIEETFADYKEYAKNEEIGTVEEEMKKVRVF